ncbi:MAG TPA: alkylhydroperoxidase [Acetobacteraceae bacterium]|jgi:AhpD family alkylhydroperoxidase|nr:alkylhydroperoxidase [Acetobacteraceae bacterium]
MSHRQRPTLREIAPDAYRAVSGVEAYITRCGLEKSLIELVKMRASQINGCAFCLNMHSQHAREHGETEQRLYLLDAWRETPFYTERERAALAWTEHLTRLSSAPPPDAAHDHLSDSFSPVEIANLTVLIGLINLWNRIAVGGGFHLEAA